MNELATIEALLFVAGDDGLTIEELSKLTNQPLDTLSVLVKKLEEKYQKDQESGLMLIETASQFQIVTKKEYAAYIKRYAQSPFSQTLSRALLETLAIIAYKQPITRIEIEDIRGVQVAGNLQKLKTRQLVEEAGRLDKPGRPLLYSTTPFFLDYFGINSISELPELSETLEETEISDLFFKDFQQSFEDFEELEENDKIEDKNKLNQENNKEG